MFTGCPTILRADKGTENVQAGTAQIALRLNHDDVMAGSKSFMLGASVHNVVGCYLIIATQQYICYRELKVGGLS